MPVQGGGAQLSWGLNNIIPDIIGNIGGPQNYAQGFQMPTVDLTYGLLDGSALTCPIHYDILKTFLERDTTASHDVSDSGELVFFDGLDGWTFANSKPNSFNISVSKGAMVNMSASYAVYVPVGGTNPAQRTTPLTYSGFSGSPITWQQVCYFSDVAMTTPLTNVWTASVQYSNNLDPDMSQVCESGSQKVYPIDVNARTPSAGIRLVFPAGAVAAGSYPVAQGAPFVMQIGGAAIGVNIIAPKVVWNEIDSRQIGVGRQFRVFDGRCLAVGVYAGGTPGVSFSNNCLYVTDIP